MVTGTQAVFEQQPAQADQRLAQQVHLAVERHRLLAGVLDVDFRMVLKVFADPWQVVADLDPGLFQHRLRAYP
ncbi:hypothetical protein D3C72_2010530 [compost metagenome]